MSGSYNRASQDFAGDSYLYGPQSTIRDAYNTGAQTQLYAGDETIYSPQNTVRDAYNTGDQTWNRAGDETLYNPQSTIQDAYNTSYQYESIANNVGGAQTYVTQPGTLPGSRMEPEKASALQSSAGQGNVYYLEYHGGVTINNDIKKGENWEAIRQSIYDEAESDLESGISDIEEVLFQ